MKYAEHVTRVAGTSTRTTPNRFVPASSGLQPEPELTVTWRGEKARYLLERAERDGLPWDDYVEKCVVYYERRSVAKATGDVCTICVPLVAGLPRSMVPCVITWPCGHSWEVSG